MKQQTNLSLCRIAEDVKRCSNESEKLGYCRRLIYELDPELREVGRLGSGVESVVFEVEKRGQIYAIKISKGGDFSREAEAHNDLKGIEGVPALFCEYGDKNRKIVALLKEKIACESLMRHGGIGLFSYHIDNLVKAFAERGYLLPLDTNPDNIHYDIKKRIICILDLGNAVKIRDAREQDRRNLEKRLKTLKERFDK